ncbi:MAG: Mth938-like domain-containing protein [Rhodospirillales bacterium]|nr:Mth938-like domain-containing protein [Rhodospirillales bacterium]MDH3790165.1 Mth938-like domain-containing protein [Rhodospirillales bacterium]MDH3911806.1 Mth938-like domain-containing protein [Rhodospirillales bacterium]MDH3918035.1 Mth938-like domain-containing protein [Rhodospirillales bacterium]MDH3969027.1 Mth938-like domain-containing protein [Rhodospirillales bacterium]
MTDVTPEIPADRQLVEAYGDGGFKVSGMAYRGSILVLPERTLGWPVADIGELTLESLEPILAEGSAIELLLLGCGPRLAFIAPDLRQQVRAAGPVLEPMDTGAACRTYHVLLAEGRRVAAALIAVE